MKQLNAYRLILAHQEILGNLFHLAILHLVVLAHLKKISMCLRHLFSINTFSYDLPGGPWIPGKPGLPIIDRPGGPGVPIKVFVNSANCSRSNHSNIDKIIHIEFNSILHIYKLTFQN